jgi:hypothetical protein
MQSSQKASPGTHWRYSKKQERLMVSAAKKPIDVSRLMSDLSAAKVELLSAQCAADRIRLQYTPQEIAAFGDRQTLKRVIASAAALHHFFSQIETHFQNEPDAGNDKR